MKNGPEIIFDTIRVLDYVNQGVPLAANASMVGIGLERDGRLDVGVIYEGYNGRNVWMHTRVTGRLTKDMLRYSFMYPFIQLGCERVSGYVDASNAAARRFDEGLGFQVEATLRGAARDGGDVLIYVMKREWCRYV